MSAMGKINVKGLICLEAGTGAGNMTRWLAKKGAKLVTQSAIIKNTWNTLVEGYLKSISKTSNSSKRI